MATKRSPLIWLNGVALVVMLVWLWIAPRRSWNRLLEAVDHGDATALVAQIDLARLQDNLRKDLQVAMMNQPGIQSEVSRGEASDAMLNSLVEAAASPSGIEETLASFGYHRSSSIRPELSFKYRHPFRVDIWMHAPGTPESERGVFTMQLSGTRWKLVRIRSAWLLEKGG